MGFEPMRDFYIPTTLKVWRPGPLVERAMTAAVLLNQTRGEPYTGFVSGMPDSNRRPLHPKCSVLAN